MNDKQRKLLDKAVALLEQYGGLYSIEDIVAAIKTGDMQSFSVNDSWIVTRVMDFPQARVLEIVLALGDLEDLEYMYYDVMDFAKVNGAQKVLAHGRMGWQKKAADRGWKTIRRSTYIKDVSDGWP